MAKAPGSSCPFHRPSFWQESVFQVDLGEPSGHNNQPIFTYHVIHDSEDGLYKDPLPFGRGLLAQISDQTQEFGGILKLEKHGVQKLLDRRCQKDV
jgi:hypothetical protein